MILMKSYLFEYNLLRIRCHTPSYIVQDIDPCEDLTDDDIRILLQNATGTRSALCMPEVGLCAHVIISFCSILDTLRKADPACSQFYNLPTNV